MSVQTLTLIRTLTRADWVQLSQSEHSPTLHYALPVSVSRLQTASCFEHSATCLSIPRSQVSLEKDMTPPPPASPPASSLSLTSHQHRSKLDSFNSSNTPCHRY